MSINKLKYTGDYVLKARFEPVIFKYFQILHVVRLLHVPLFCDWCFFVSMVAKIKLCVLKSRSAMFHCTMYTVKDRDIAQFTNFDLLSDTFSMGQ